MCILLKLGAVLFVKLNGIFGTKLCALCANRSVKLTPGVNFTIILQASFASRSQKRKKDSQIKQLFSFSEPNRMKAARNYVVEIAPEGGLLTKSNLSTCRKPNVSTRWQKYAAYKKIYQIWNNTCFVLFRWLRVRHWLLRPFLCPHLKRMIFFSINQKSPKCTFYIWLTMNVVMVLMKANWESITSQSYEKNIVSILVLVKMSKLRERQYCKINIVLKNIKLVQNSLLMQ